MVQPAATRQNLKVRAAILDAAFSLVGEVGYDKLTIEGIANRAGCGKQTIYRWWPSKAMVLLDALVEKVKCAWTFDDTGNFREDMLGQMERVSTLLTQGETSCLFIGLLVEAQFDDHVAQGMNELIYEPTYRAACERVLRGQRAGEVNAELDPVLVVELLYAPIYYRLVVPYCKLDPADVPGIFDLAVKGLKPDQSEKP
jgi:AcrR family transcriptional regulator